MRSDRKETGVRRTVPIRSGPGGSAAAPATYGIHKSQRLSCVSSSSCSLIAERVVGTEMGGENRHPSQRR
jgi:hypothetical protein